MLVIPHHRHPKGGMAALEGACSDGTGSGRTYCRCPAGQVPTYLRAGLPPNRPATRHCQSRGY